MVLNLDKAETKSKTKKPVVKQTKQVKPKVK